METSRTEDVPIPIRYVHHVALRVDDLVESLRFYRDLLGFVPLPRPDLAFAGAWLQVGDVQVHLLELVADESTGFPPTQVSGRANHVAFSVADLATFRRFLEGHGIAISEPVSGLPQLFIADPSGNILEFTQFSRSSTRP